ncbi:hypothetical protein HDU67_009483 [Dinochytrium kinnereticum]|nr:hypothetical protein HDU67_009483 [Dinochytrium kinnereticum]
MRSVFVILAAIVSSVAASQVAGNDYKVDPPKSVSTKAPVDAPYGGESTKAPVDAPYGGESTKAPQSSKTAEPYEKASSTKASTPTKTPEESKDYGVDKPASSKAGEPTKDGKDYGVTSTKAPVPTSAGKDYGVPPPALTTTKAPVKSTPAYTPECPEEETTKAPVKPTPTPTAAYSTPKPTTKAPVLTNLVDSSASGLKASVFVMAGAAVAALYL